MNSEENKVLVRQFVEEVDAEWGSTDYIDRWLTPDFQFHLNGTDMDLAAYRQGMALSPRCRTRSFS